MKLNILCICILLNSNVNLYLYNVLFAEQLTVCKLIYQLNKLSREKKKGNPLEPASRRV